MRHKRRNKSTLKTKVPVENLAWYDKEQTTDDKQKERNEVYSL